MSSGRHLPQHYRYSRVNHGGASTDRERAARNENIISTYLTSRIAFFVVGSNDCTNIRMAEDDAKDRYLTVVGRRKSKAPQVISETPSTAECYAAPTLAKRHRPKNTPAALLGRYLPQDISCLISSTITCSERQGLGATVCFAGARVVKPGPLHTYSTTDRGPKGLSGMHPAWRSHRLET
jgi:hypothetical protein